jgi:hypothetical protein
MMRKTGRVEEQIPGYLTCDLTSPYLTHPAASLTVHHRLCLTLFASIFLNPFCLTQLTDSFAYG